MHKIAILCRVGKPYDDVETTKRSWLKHLERDIVDPETSIYYYFKKYYPDVIIHRYTINTIHKLNPKDYDVVFNLFFDLITLFHKIVREKQNKNGWNVFIKKYKSINNLVPSAKLVHDFIPPKCVYLKWLKKNKYPILPTKCIDVKTQTFEQFRKHFKGQKSKFVKPTPSAESKNTNLIYPVTDIKYIDKYLRKIKKIGYNKILIQNYLENFASNESPELRTYWVGTQYMYTIETIENGTNAKIRKSELPMNVFRQSKEIIMKLNKKFHTQMIVTRIDWGFVDNKYFINEIEYAPGVFSDLFERGWDLDKHMAKYMYCVLKSKKSKYSSSIKLDAKTSNQ